jgi:hypothetical protein
MINGVLAMTLHWAQPDNPQPETAIVLTNQHGLRCSFAVGIQQRHTKFFSHLRSLGALAQEKSYLLVFHHEYLITM